MHGGVGQRRARGLATMGARRLRNGVGPDRGVPPEHRSVLRLRHRSVGDREGLKFEVDSLAEPGVVKANGPGREGDEARRVHGAILSIRQPRTR